MEKSQVKPNDIFVATFNAPDASLLDFLRSGINATNTSKLKKEEYQNTPFVKKRFTDEKGVFNQDAFDKFYEKAEENFNLLADENALLGLKEYLTYGKDSMYKPYDAKELSTSYKAETFKNNPLNRSIGIVGLNQKSSPKFTEEEAAQTNRIWDSKNKKWINATAEDRNFFKKALGETLVYAKYDKTGEQINPVTGEIGYHYKDEWIKDETGNYFTETLGDRQLLDKQVVALGDILTKEGSALNKFDFWDSDGYDKSVGGIAMKTIVSILPYVTPIRGYYGAFTMAMQIVSAMPALYKSLESIILGENQSGLTPTMTALENWFAKWDSSKSHKGRESFWNIESLGELVADTFGQLYQQRAAAELAPKVLAKFDPDLAKAVKYHKLMEAGKIEEAMALNATGSLKKMNDVSSGLTFAYLGLTQGADMYNETLKAGYDKRTAGIASLATMASLFGIMKYNEGKNGLGTWFLDKTTGYTRDVDRAIVTSAAKKELNSLRNEIQKAVINGDRSRLAYTMKEWKRKGASVLHDAFVIGGEDLWKGFLVEGVEEVTEEATQDLVKGLIDTMSWLGYTSKQGSFGGWDNVFSKEGMSRYLSTFVGGGLGGALFSALNRWINPAVDQLFGLKNGRPDSNQQRENYEIAQIILDGRFDEYMQELDKCKKFIKNSLDATVVAEGNNEAYNISTQGESQADLVVRLAKEKAITMKNLLEGAVGNFDQLSDFEKRFIAANFASIYGSKGNNFDKEYLNAQFTKAAERILSARESLATFDNKETKDLTPEEKLLKEEAKRELDAAVDEFKNFFDAKHYALYSIDGAIIGNSKLSKALMSTSLEDYARNVFHLDITKLTDEKLKERIKEEWEITQLELTKENMVEIIPRLRNLFLEIFNTVSPEISQFTDDAQVGELIKYIHHLNENPDAIQEELFLALTGEINANDPLAEQKYREILQQIYNNSFTQNLLLLAKIKPEFLSIGPRHDFDLYSAIKPALTIDASGHPLSKEAENLIIQTINELASRSSINIWTPEHILEFINSIQSIFNDTTNVYRRRLDEQRRADLPEDQLATAVLVPIELNLDVTKIPENIRSIKINSLRDFAKLFNVIDSELQEHLAGMYISDIIDKAERIDELNINSDDIDIVEGAKGFLSEELKLKEIKLKENKTNVQKLKDILELVKSKSTSGDKVAQVALDSLFQIQRDPLTEVVTLDSQWLADATSLINMPVVENPIVKALKKLYVGVNGSESGKDIFDFLADKSGLLSTLEGLNKELSLSDQNVLESAAKTLDLMLTVIDASVGTRISIDPRTGLNSVIEGGIIDYGKHFLEMSGEDSSKFKPISDIGARLTKGYIYDLIGRLNQLTWFDRLLGMYKNKLDEEARRQYMIGFAHDILSKEIKIGLSHKISAWLPDEIPDDEELCENAIELRLQEISVKFAELLKDENFIEEAKKKTKSPKLYLIDCILENFKNTDFINPIQKANDLYTWDWKTKSGKLNQYWLAKRIVECIIKDRITIQKDIHDILSSNLQIYPKFDQMIDMEEMLYQAYDITSREKNDDGVIYYFNSQVNERNKKNKGLKSQLNILSNTIAILGGPGAGKSFLLKICKNKLESILEDVKFKVSAESKKKVEDLKKDTESEGNTINGLLEEINPGLVSMCQEIDDMLKMISKSWNESVIENNAEKPTLEKLENFIKSIPSLEETEKKSIKKVTSILDDAGNIIGMTVLIGDEKTEISFYFQIESEVEGTTKISIPVTLTPIITVYPDLNLKLDDNLIIDESTLVSPAKMMILSQAVSLNKRMLILSGDHRLQGYLIDSGNQKANLSYYEVFYPNSAPMLISSYRFTSNIKTNNISQIAGAIEQWENEYDYGINLSNLINPSLLSKLKSNLEKVPLNWQVFRNGPHDGIFIGDKIDSDRNLFNLDLAGFLIPEIQKGKTLVVISENSADEEEIKKILKDKGLDVENKEQIEFLQVSDVQGGEYDYVISYKLKKSSSEFDLDFDIAKAYTILSRSKYGTLVLDEADGLFKNSGINSNPKESKDGIIFDSDDSVANNKRNQRILNIIDLLSESSSTPEPSKPTESEDNPDLLDPLIDDPEPEKSDDDKDKSSKTRETLKFFKDRGIDVSILHGWYTRLGTIDWRNSDIYFGSSDKIGEILAESDKEYLNNENLSDLSAYYKDKVNKYNATKTGKNPTRISVHDLALEFLAEKNRVLKLAETNSSNLRFRYWCKLVEIEKDYPYAKLNHNNETIGDYLQLIQVYDEEIKGWITIAKLGYNLDENENVISTKQALYFDKYKDSTFEFTLVKNSKLKEALKKAIQEYMESRGIEIKYDSGVFRYTGLRDYRPDPNLISNELLPEKEKDKNSSEFYFYNKNQMQFSRLTIKDLLLFGYKISDNYWDPLDKKEGKFDAFKKWYNNYRLFEPIEDKEWDKFKGLENRVWIVIEQIGTGYKFPVLVNKIQSTYIENIPSTEKGNVKSFGYTQIARALKHLIKQSNLENKDRIISLMEEKNPSDSTPEAIRILEVIKENWADVSKILVDALNDESSEKLSEDELNKELFDPGGFLEFTKLQFNSVSNLGIKGISVDVSFHKTEDLKNFKFIHRLSDKLEGFFFTTSTNSVNNLILEMKTSDNYVASRFFETPRYFFFWDAIEVIDESNPPSQELTDEEMFEELNKDLGLKDSTELLNYINLLDPKLGSISGLYKSIDKNNLLLDIKILKDNLILLSLSKDIDQMNDVEKQDYRNILLTLKLNLSKYPNIIKKIDEKLNKLLSKKKLSLEEFGCEALINVVKKATTPVEGEAGVKAEDIFNQFRGLGKLMKDKTFRNLDENVLIQLRDIIDQLKSKRNRLGLRFDYDYIKDISPEKEDIEMIKLLYQTKC